MRASDFHFRKLCRQTLARGLHQLGDVAARLAFKAYRLANDEVNRTWTHQTLLLVHKTVRVDDRDGHQGDTRLDGDGEGTLFQRLQAGAVGSRAFYEDENGVAAPNSLAGFLETYHRPTGVTFIYKNGS